MNSAKIVVNASPIISLAKIGQADLLLELSSELVVPQGVYEEITAYKKTDPAVQWLAKRPCSLTKPVDVPPAVAEWNLGKGESQVIAFAYLHREFLASIDDRSAKKSAELFGINVRGTMALIITAKNTGLIPAAKPLFTELRANGFRVSDTVYQAALKYAGEATPA